MTRFVTVFSVILIAFATFGGAVHEITEAHVWRSVDGQTLPYRVHFPEAARRGWRYPLVVHLHGAGSRGTDNAAQLNVGPAQFADWASRRGVDYVLVAPQCPSGQQWVDTPWSGREHRMKETPTPWMRMAMEIIEATMRDSRVDPSRVYVTGVSMGGYASWELAQRHPEWLAGALICCGGGDVTLAKRLKDVPIWAFHGDADKTVPVFRSRAMVSAIWMLEGKVRYREYPGCGHGCWTPTFADDSVFDWLFEQRKDLPRDGKVASSRWRGHRMAVIGDCQVANNRRPVEETWHARFAAGRSMEYANFGVNGSRVAVDCKTNDAVRTRCREVRDFDLVLLVAGANDGCIMRKGRLEPGQFKTALAETVRTLKANNPKAEIAVISPWRIDKVPAMATVIGIEREIAAAEGVRFADATPFTGIDPDDPETHRALFQGPKDHLHLNREGHGVALAAFGPWLDGAEKVAREEDFAALPDDEGLFPFVIRPDAADSAMDMSGLLVAPAGRNGFLRCSGEHLVDGKGNRVRLNGINLTGAANFPTHDEADRLAAHFARLGFNCARLHFFDTVAYANMFQDPAPCLFRADPSGRTTIIDEKQRDRLEYLIAALKAKGVYVNLNLHVAHELGPGDGIAKTGWANRGVDYFSPELIAAEKDYARDILRHVNPYTKLALADDPAMACVEINNENALMQVYWTKTLQRQGADPVWLKTFDRLREASGHEDTADGLNRFIVETETRYFRTMTDCLKRDLGVKCPVYGTQLGYTAPWTMTGSCDLMDIHIYWGNPSLKVPPGVDRKKGRVPGTEWTVGNVSLVASGTAGRLANPIPVRGARRVKGMPFTVSECASPYPGWYSAEFQPIIHAYAAFQDWAGVYTYSWNNETTAFPDHNVFFFYHSARPDCLAHLPASSALFLRGDAAVAKERVDVAADAEGLYAKAAAHRNHDHLTDVDLEEATDGAVSDFTFLNHAVSVDFSGRKLPVRPLPLARAEGTFVSDTGELRLRQATDGTGSFIADTPNVKVLAGFLDNRRIGLGGAEFRFGRTKLGWCTVSLLSRDGNGFSRGARLLLAATGYTHNGGARLHRRDGGLWGGTLEEFGSGKVVTEGVPLEVTLPADGVRCWALDESGARGREVPVVASNGRSVVSVGPQCRTVWYEIQL